MTEKKKKDPLVLREVVENTMKMADIFAEGDEFTPFQGLLNRLAGLCQQIISQMDMQGIRPPDPEPERGPVIEPGPQFEDLQEPEPEKEKKGSKDKKKKKEAKED